MRCLMAVIVSASFDGSDPVTTCPALFDKVHGKFQVSFVLSTATTHMLLLVRLPLPVALYDVIRRTLRHLQQHRSARGQDVAVVREYHVRYQQHVVLVLSTPSCFVTLSSLFPWRSQSRITMLNKEGLSFPPCLTDLSKPTSSTAISWKLTMFCPTTCPRSSSAIASVGCVALSTSCSHADCSGVTR